MSITTYDDVVYPSYPFHQSHPETLATVARFFGLRAPDVPTCRVLELGCASGGNLLPMAEAYPQAEFVGIDLSPRQIEMGNAVVRTLGLKNLSLRAGSILEIGPDWGEFDYILCHGVYSWVPEEVRAKILSISRQNLTPNGVAYISYNTYPGWHMRGMLREIMCFHAARFTQAAEQVREARELLNFLSEAGGGETTPYGLLLKQETTLLANQSDSYLYHEHLEEHNNPCYFFEFAQQAREHGLQYLGDAAFQTMFPGNHPPKILATLNRLARDLIQLEQYLDFVRNRTFRASLLCRADVPLVRVIDVDLLQDMHLSANVAREEKPDAEPGLATFTVESTGTVTTSDAKSILALEIMGKAWPESVPFDRLASEMTAKGLMQATPEGRHELAASLMTLLAGSVISASIAPARCVRELSQAPAISPLARYMGSREGWAPTRRHFVYKTDDLGKRILPLLNGQRTRGSVLEELMREFRSGKLPIKKSGAAIRDPEEARTILETGLASCLNHLSRAGMLIG